MVDITFARSRFTEHDAARLVHEHFAIDGTARPLPSERDQNFRIDAVNGRQFVLKIANATEDAAVLDLQTEALLHLERTTPDLALPRLVLTAGGATSTTAQDPSGRAHTVRLLTYVAGRTLAACRPHSPALLRGLGEVLGRLDRALESFDHPAADRSLKWDPRRAGWIRAYLPQVTDDGRRALVERLFEWSDGALTPLAPRLPVSVIYNDANDHNVLVDAADPYAQRVAALIDFGDLLRTWTANELAVAIAYAMLGKPDPLTAAAAIVAGYHAARPLTDDERAALWPLVIRRLSVSVVNAAHQRHVDPANAYLFVTEQPAWTLLAQFDTLSPALVLATFRHACGLEPSPVASDVTRWLTGHRADIGPLLDPDPSRATRRVFDLSVSSTEAGTPDTWADPARFSRHLSRLMEDADATVGIGRYDEVRACYASEVFVTPGHDGPEWRTVHLGLDLFADPGTPVLAPLPGVVHSVADNAGALDYGPTVILEHDTSAEGGPRFYTLYGHLTRDALAALPAGRHVARGECVARVGEAAENGGWPPHLHFQIITDLLGRRGDFPGVAAPASRDVWLSLSPDPNLIANLPDAVRAPRHAAPQDLLERRHAHLGPSLSVSYRRPLTIVRGWKQHLYDADGRAYLDAVNNVPHVGHCHPRVVEAGQRQMAVLNTNTRYLHGLIGEYAARLCATLPEPLRVCFFVNSGSEANELALRLARAVTGRRDMLVIESGYHGNTTTIVDISSYKFDGPGGTGAPSWVHTVPVPDAYRGRHRGTEPGIGAAYARHAVDAIARMADAGTRPAAFIAESILSCGGQVVLPEGYLASCYGAVRGAGGLCIADEVQVGFGRAGRHFWAFESQGVVPDIVTMGKPAGNGHPLGIVVTTKAIADAFANGMEYFNTFGGNPVSCAIGLAVLDVIRDERLQENAVAVGEHLLSRLRGLRARRPLVGDVRGLGLFVGVELVRDRVTLEPADLEAGLVVNRMRDRGVLVSTDGPFHNVIKIKPPMCVTRADADRLADTLGTALDELA